jgi:hypothetical protein
MESLIFVSLIGLTVNDKPIFDYEYVTTTSYGITESVSGTHFYERSKPQIKISTYYCFDTFGCGELTLDSGYTTSKQSKEIEINWTPEIKIFQQERFFVTLTPTFKFGGRTKSEACLDNIGRNFHCYYGTQPNSPLFFSNFEAINSAMRSKNIDLTNLEVKATWKF